MNAIVDVESLRSHCELLPNSVFLLYWCKYLDIHRDVLEWRARTSRSLDCFICIYGYQVQQEADENMDSSGRWQVWQCESGSSSSSIREYYIREGGGRYPPSLPPTSV